MDDFCGEHNFSALKSSKITTKKATSHQHDGLDMLAWFMLSHELMVLVMEHAHTYMHIKGIKNGCQCIVEIRGMQGCALMETLQEP